MLNQPKEFWNRRAQTYDQTSGGIYAQAYDKTVSNSLNYLKGSDRVLEFACGTGLTTLRLAPHAAYIRGWLDSGSFDAVTAFNVLLYLPNRSSVLFRIGELLKPGGLFLSATDCLGSRPSKAGIQKFIKSHTGAMPYVAFFTQRGLEKTIVQNGFTILERENLFPNPPNLFIAARKA